MELINNIAKAHGGYSVFAEFLQTEPHWLGETRRTS
jgi:hypothetical protein